MGMKIFEYISPESDHVWGVNTMYISHTLVYNRNNIGQMSSVIDLHSGK